MKGPRGFLEQMWLNSKNRTYQSYTFDSGDELIANNFKYWPEESHVNRRAFAEVLLLAKEHPQIIIETGTSAWGTDSTRIWDSYVRRFGGKVYSVDIRVEASLRLASQISKNTHLVVQDSVDFLSENRHLVGDIYFLDSFDLGLSDPPPSALHGLA
jgi:hypothetical protein